MRGFLWLMLLVEIGVGVYLVKTGVGDLQTWILLVMCTLFTLLGLLIFAPRRGPGKHS